MFDISNEDIKNDKKREFNKRQKSLIKLVGENLASYACLLIVVLFIGLIWTDIGIKFKWATLLTDSVISVVLFIVAEYLTSKLGVNGGKLDENYINIHKEYLALREEVVKAGITFMDKFCEWQMDVEYEAYIKKKCKEYKIDYVLYIEKYSDMNPEELKKELPAEKIAAVDMLNKVSRIELTPDILLTDGKQKSERGNVPLSGEEYVEKHTTSLQHILLIALSAVITAIPVFTLTQDMSIGRVIYTIFKLAMLIYRMYNGYASGALAFNTIEPKHLQVKIRYLNLYLEFLKNMKVSRDGEISREGEDYGKKTDKSEQTDPPRRGENKIGGELHDRSAESV